MDLLDELQQLVEGANPRSPAQVQPSYNAAGLSDPSYLPLARKWVLKGLLELGIHNSVLLPDRIEGGELLSFVGLEQVNGEHAATYDHDCFLGALERLHGEYRDVSAASVGPRPLEECLQWLGQRLGLDSSQLEILRFMILARECDAVCETLDRMGPMRTGGLLWSLGKLLDLSPGAVFRAMKSDSPLMSSGLVSMSRDRKLFSEKIWLLSNIIDEVHSESGKPEDLLRRALFVSKLPRLTMSDYPHLRTDTEILRSHLAVRARPGVNILIHGLPGTGKTEYVRALADAMGMTLYEVRSARNNGQAMSGNERLNCYHFAQRILKHDPDSFILFDEVEDVFSDEKDDSLFGDSVVVKKAWMNHLLEENHVPAFWLSNVIDRIDPALIRRFDYVLQLGAPPRSVRTTVMERYFSDHAVRRAWICRMAEHEQLLPALVERASRVTAQLARSLPAPDVETAATRAINGTLGAMALPKLPDVWTCQAGTYRVECLNTDPAVSEIASAMKTFGRGRLCLFGPPGTGKSAFARHLVASLDLPLLIRRASDLLSPYVGKTEANIAEMFARAREDKAAVLLDEADGLLRSRETATYSWELTQVNEMLTQIESFEGVFIASTNMLEHLDAATMRRFDLKGRFDWLLPHQAERLFEDVLAELELAPGKSASARVRSLRQLTPGDFAMVYRQAQLRRFRHADEVAEALAGELKYKPHSVMQRIGF